MANARGSDLSLRTVAPSNHLCQRSIEAENMVYIIHFQFIHLDTLHFLKVVSFVSPSKHVGT